MQPTPDAANISFPVRLWTDAYDRINQDDPKLVEAYKQILYRKLRDESSAANIRNGEDRQTNPEPIRRQMVLLAEAALKKTEKEAVAISKMQDGIRVVSLIKDIIGITV